MENMIFIPKEEDFRRWVREEIDLAMQKLLVLVPKENRDDILISRVRAAEILDVSLVTLNDWTKKGLPSYKNEGKVYFFLHEVYDYIKEKGSKNYLSKINRVENLLKPRVP